MKAKIVAVVNQKGGAGKTTLTMQLAGTLGRRGHRVLVVDADSQGTATRWAASAQDDKPFPATVVGLSAAQGKLHREVARLAPDYRYIVVDGPPAADSPIARSALLAADLALVPVIPSPLDIWASVGIRRTIAEALDLNEGLLARLVVNQCQPNTSLAREVLELLPEFGVAMADSQLRQRTVYRQCAVYGQTVHEFGYKGAAAIQEINALCDEVLALLHGKGGEEGDHQGSRG